MVHPYHPRTQETEAEAGGSCDQGQSGLHDVFQGNLSYIVRPYFKIKKKQKQRNTTKTLRNKYAITTCDRRYQKNEMEKRKDRKEEEEEQQ